MPDAFICDGIRTPIGRYAGALAKVRTDDLAAVPIKALMQRNPAVDWSELDEVYVGCANQAGEDNRNVARMALLLAGLPDSVPGVTLNRLCASGLNAVGAAAQAIRAGDIDLAIAGGVESMTRAPFVQGKATEAFSRSAEVYDTTIGWRFINPLMKKQYGVDAMPETGENVAEEFQVKRADQDAFAWRSQQRAGKAIAAGYFAEEIAPVEIPGKTPTVVDKDEHPRPETTLEALSKLKTPFREPGTVTAGNASGVNDGAAAMLIASDAAVKTHGLKPLARITGMASAGVPPRIMGIGPVPSTRKLMQRLGLRIGDFDVIELNEAFASQALACLRQLGLSDDAEHVNPNGGAIALGHPLGMSGTRLALTAAHQMTKHGGKRALATMCVGVGQGVSLAMERV
jgi:3-oxoadipyl-CoA thiolase